MKKDYSEFHFITHLSHPQGSSVNQVVFPPKGNWKNGLDSELDSGLDFRLDFIKRSYYLTKNITANISTLLRMHALLKEAFLRLQIKRK